MQLCSLIANYLLYPINRICYCISLRLRDLLTHKLCVFIRLSILVFVCLPDCLSVWLFVCLTDCLSSCDCLPDCLFACPTSRYNTQNLLIYSSSMIHSSFTHHSSIIKLERLVGRLKRQGFLSEEDMEISQLANKSDQNLFQAIRNNPHHVLYRLLPELKKTCYNTRIRAHDSVVPPKDYSNYIGYLACCTLT